MNVPFIKMHGLGNDFVVIDGRTESDAAQYSKLFNPRFAKAVCDRRFGVGADQLLWLRAGAGGAHAPHTDVKMEILNADGSTAEMCGNGIRCVALYLQSVGVHQLEGAYFIDTLAGLKTVKIKGDAITVDMGPPHLGQVAVNGGESLQIGGENYQFIEVSMGNPHAVIFVPDVSKVDLERVGPGIETHKRFPKRTNVEFVQVTGDSRIKVRVWERGAGATLACGTGACAAGVAAVLTQKVKSPVTVELPGGSLVIDWTPEAKGASPNTVQSPVMMTGPATEVFRGEFEYSL